MKKKMNQATIKTNADVARDAATDAKDYADKAAASCRGAAVSSDYARVQANVAKNASADAQKHNFIAKEFAEDAKRHYLSAKACASDAFEQRKKTGISMDKAAHEARSAMYCVVWCFCAAVLSLLFLIAHFIL